MADYGFKVALPGQSATTLPNTPANIRKFSLISSLNLLKVLSSAKVAINNGADHTVSHGLSYTPIFWCFMKNGSSQMVPVYYDTSGTYAYVDSTQLKIHNADGATRDFYYYLFHDPV